MTEVSQNENGVFQQDMPETGKRLAQKGGKRASQETGKRASQESRKQAVQDCPVKEENGIFILETAHTSYIIKKMETGHLEHLYYGPKISLSEDGCAALSHKCANLNGCSIAYSKDYPNVGLDDICLEVSGEGKGDFRQPFAKAIFGDGSSTSDFLYESCEILKGKPSLKTLPSSYDETGSAYTLRLVLKEKYQAVKLELLYSVFPDCDCITRSAAFINEGKEDIRIERLMSLQLDLEGSGYRFTSFHGDWTREMQRNDVFVSAGRFVNSSNTGFSSNLANPFVMLSERDTSEDAGSCIGCNLIYSGNHYEAAETSGHGKTRFLAGINPETFSWQLPPRERLEAPEAVLTFSETGWSGISLHMHAFVREHIVRGEWKYKERPVLLNSWEAAYFQFNENKLLKLAKAGKEAGIELFVMDDGWFGKRDKDTCSLGDWTENRKKLPGGIRGLAEKINAMGMQFGIWVEPEMVNEDSDLYREHPDYAVHIPGREQSLGRNQMLLDFTRKEVRENIIGQMSRVFSFANIAYVKWDMNRHFSDCYAPALGKERQGEFAHRYILGLYEVLSELTGRFPHILFEGCASGGNRFDLGMLCYMPQIWTSDNTDAISRAAIQNGGSYGYPQSVMGAHVSGCPNHQTLRTTPLETRFAVAAFGVLGYECNLCEMPGEELEEIREQVRIYKKWRKVFQFGRLYRVGGSMNAASGRETEPGQLVKWIAAAPEQDRAVGMMVQDLTVPNSGYAFFRTKGLSDEKAYRFTNRALKYNIHRFGDLINTIAPVHIKKDSLVHNAIAKFVKLDGEKEDYTVSGSLLNHAGIKLSQGFGGVGYGENTRLYQDFDSRMYFMEAVDSMEERPEEADSRNVDENDVRNAGGE